MPDETLYQLCKHCDHFGEEDGITPGHFCDECHHVADDFHAFEPREDNEGKTIEQWQKERPDLFFEHEDGLIGPNSQFHVTQLEVKPEWEGIGRWLIR